MILKPERTTKIKAFTNTIENKTQAVKAAKMHRKADMLIQGTYEDKTSKQFKGCSVGCTYKPFEGKIKAASLHALSEPVHGVPAQLTYLRDKIFERLSTEDSKNWHVDFTVSINVGADLSQVIDKWMLFIVEDVQKFAKGAGLKAIKDIAELFKKKISGVIVTREEWLTARKAAYAYAAAAYAAAAYADAAYADADAAAAAAYAAAYADAAYADADAAAAAAYAAADAAAAYADADAAAAYAAAAAAYAAAAAARRKSFKGYVEQLLKIIKETK